MKTNIIVIDDFYPDPDIIRAFALVCDFGVRGNYPGSRTGPVRTEWIRKNIEKIIRAKITNWDANSYNGAFQLALATDKTWIHADSGIDWAGVLYLTPNAPLNSGTVFFKHVSGHAHEPTPNIQNITFDGNDMSTWELAEKIGNRYNRLILYNGAMFHCSDQYFGTDLHNGRLFQTFFFNAIE